jgi:hypothetical protein
MFNFFLKAQRVVPEYFPPIGSDIYLAKVRRTQYQYLPILKNAHSWAKILLETNLQFTKTDRNKILPIGKVIVILRDPVERWIAGAAQYLSAYDPDVCSEFVSNDNFMKLLCDIGRIDGHTNRQLDVFFDFNIKQCIFFKCDSTLEPTMHHFIKTIAKRDTVVPCDQYHRFEEGNESKLIAYQALTERLKDHEYFDRVNRYVLPDIKLLEYVTENNLWYDAR